jgi:hypothetical protein
MRDGRCWERTTWAPRTGGRGSGSWPTPHGLNENESRDHGPSGNELGRAVNLYPTPSAITYGYNQGGQNPGGPIRASLETMARRNLWPTPDARDCHAEGFEAGKRRLEKWGTLGLQTAVKLWPKTWSTPTVGDASCTTSPRPSRAATGRTTDYLSRQIGDGGPATPQTKRPALNPSWVEWLMGWPIGATALRRLATGRFRLWLEQHGKY